MIKEFITHIQEDEIFDMAAALSFYFIFSLAPFIILLASIASIFLSDAAVSTIILDEAQRMLGKDGAKIVLSILDKNLGALSSLISLFLLFLSGTRFLSYLRQSLDKIFKTKKKSIVHRFKKRFIYFWIVILFSIVVFVLTLFTTIFSFIGAHRFSNLVFSIIMTFIVFTLAFKYLPDHNIKLKFIMTGAFITTVLFTFSRYILKIYVSFTNFGSIYGAAGSTVILMFWVYYSVLVFYIGAEIIKIIEDRFKSPIPENPRKIFK
jgi:membrane protein